MPEERNEEKLSGDVKVTSPFLTKLENFWYHYKWTTIIVSFFAFEGITDLTQFSKHLLSDSGFINFNIQVIQ